MKADRLHSASPKRGCSCIIVFMNKDYNYGHRHKFHLNVRTVQTWEQGTRKTPDYVVWLIEKVMDLEEQLDAQRN